MLNYLHYRTGVWVCKVHNPESFYTVMYAPSCVQVGDMGRMNKRLHHKINWDNAVPKILSESYRKANG